jgi:sec-independent protein translocase protein TatA
MQDAFQQSVIFAGFIGSWEIVLIMAVVLILFAGKRLSGLGTGFGRGFFHFRKATREVLDELDEEASDAGKSFGGIYGRPTYQALSPDNQAAELYDPPRCARIPVNVRARAAFWVGAEFFGGFGLSSPSCSTGKTANLVLRRVAIKPHH